MDYLQKLGMIIYWEKATLKAITATIPNNFEFPLYSVLQNNAFYCENHFLKLKCFK